VKKPAGYVRERTDARHAAADNRHIPEKVRLQLPGRAATVNSQLEQKGFEMNSFKRVSAICLAALLVSVSGCMTTPAANQESAGEYMSDSWITTKVKAALIEDSQVRATEVNVETFKGIVQLSGFVSSGSAMAQAVRVAGGIKGVTSVKNDMRIK